MESKISFHRHFKKTTLNNKKTSINILINFFVCVPVLVVICVAVANILTAKWRVKVPEAKVYINSGALGGFGFSLLTGGIYGLNRSHSLGKLLKEECSEFKKELKMLEMDLLGQQQRNDRLTKETCMLYE